MRRLLIVCAWLACAAVATGCEGGGGPAHPPFNPFGVEPTPIMGAEPANSGDESPSPSEEGSIPQLCGQVCARIEAACSSSSTGGGCAANCAVSSSPACEPAFRVFLECVASRPLSCSGQSLILPPECGIAASALDSCES